jgi:hypothetical protein
MRQNTNTEVIVLDTSNDSPQPHEVPPTKPLTGAELYKRVRRSHGRNRFGYDQIDRDKVYEVPAEIFDDDIYLFQWFRRKYCVSPLG